MAVHLISQDLKLTAIYAPYIQQDPAALTRAFCRIYSYLHCRQQKCVFLNLPKAGLVHSEYNALQIPLRDNINEFIRLESSKFIRMKKDWLNDVSIIIPTHNRKDFLMRLLDYYQPILTSIIVA
ncbi:MAG: hypothetical protein K8F91_14540, partial [Candidatus Obscuribacterales bacterium]|nr:hypothetical protein [Candidatus Obscuribacterales bacterium]